MTDLPGNYKQNDFGEFTKRYSRQTIYEPLGVAGQDNLSKSSALIVGMGGLGSWTAELLVRMGIGRIRICDDDSVETSNLHRQAMYNESDVGSLKVSAAEKKLKIINSKCIIESFPERIDYMTIERAASGMDIIIDGLDNFGSRFLINDYSVKYSVPWIFAGVTGSEGQVVVIAPGLTPCLKCFMEEPKACCQGQTGCCEEGVIGSAVSLISSLQATEAVKLLSGKWQADKIVRKFDLWNGTSQTLDISKSLSDSCICCGYKDFEYLEP